jgi:hypothetical protein
MTQWSFSCEDKRGKNKQICKKYAKIINSSYSIHNLHSSFNIIQKYTLQKMPSDGSSCCVLNHFAFLQGVIKEKSQQSLLFWNTII